MQRKVQPTGSSAMLSDDERRDRVMAITKNFSPAGGIGSGYAVGVWAARRAMFFWDIGYYGYELLYWGSTFMAFFLSALWEESFKLKEAAEEEVVDAARRRLASAGEGDTGEYEYETSEGSAGDGTAEGVDESSGADYGAAGVQDFNTYAGLVAAVIVTLIVKYIIFPWVFISLIPRLKSMTPEGFALTMFCSFKAFGKIVKLTNEFIAPDWAALSDPESEEYGFGGKNSPVNTVGEYFGDFIFSPWLFLAFVLPLLRAMLSGSVQTKRAAA